MKLDLSELNFDSKKVNSKIKLPTRIRCELAEEIGLHVGDGSMNFYKNKGLFQLRGHITDDKDHYYHRIKQLYANVYNLNIKIRRMESTGVIGFQIWNNVIVDFKHKIIGLPLGSKKEIELPRIINRRNLFYSFMKGLFDTDGSIYFENKRGKPYPRIDIKTTSSLLSNKIHNLLNRYKIHSTLYKYERKKSEWNDLYSVIIRGFEPVSNWVKYVGSNNPKHMYKLNLIKSKNEPAEI